MTVQTQGSTPEQKAQIPSLSSVQQPLVGDASTEKTQEVSSGALVLSERSPQKSLEENIFRAIQSENHFNTTERENLIRMASLAKLMYKDFSCLHEVSDLFPRTLTIMKTPEEMGVTLPTGLRVQAFRHGDQVIIAIRGTELTKETSTLLFNLIADAGIGRHKSNEDLLDSIKRVNARNSSVHGFELDEKILTMAESIITSRVEGHTDVSRLGNMAKRIVTASGRGAAKGSAYGTAGGVILGGGAILAGLAGGPVAAGLGLTFLLASSLTGATASTIKEGAVLTTAADGYPTLLNYIQAIDDYIVALKSAGFIKDSNEVITVGHSLAGYLAGVTGAMHADEIYAFNGPGVDYTDELPRIIYNMGKTRSIQGEPAYHSISMESDFIGNLTDRSGGLRKLYLPKTSAEQCGDLPPSLYDSPLSHHGIDLMLQVLKISSASEIPLLRFPEERKEQQPLLLLTDKPHSEMIKKGNN